MKHLPPFPTLDKAHQRLMDAKRGRNFLLAACCIKDLFSNFLSDLGSPVMAAARPATPLKARAIQRPGVWPIAAFLDGIAIIIALRPQEKMVWINATADVALVKHAQCAGRSLECRPCCSMSKEADA
jgi:hypothetical protein